MILLYYEGIFMSTQRIFYPHLFARGIGLRVVGSLEVRLLY